jgi:crossover junction endodeoxyribonuclease RuvC
MKASNLSGKPPLRILGIDPGTLVMGYAITEVYGGDTRVLTVGALRMHYGDDAFDRLLQIHDVVNGLIEEFQPTHCAIEAPFYGKNVQSMLKLGRAQGVAIACALKYKMPVVEYAPRKIKQAITGNGNAGKEAVWTMLQHITKLREKPKGFDASDALAVAICHQLQLCSPILPSEAKGKGWEAFIKKNPGRVKD